MTEADWLVCANPWVLLQQTPRAAGDRKYRLFVCACCGRRLADSPFEGLRMVLHQAEAFADRAARAEDLARSRQELEFGLVEIHEDLAGVAEAIAFALSVQPVLPAHAALAADLVVQSCADADSAPERAEQCRLLRDIFGNPFRAVSDCAAMPEHVAALAQDIYLQRHFERLPALGAALEDAGYGDTELLDHCRQPGPHVRGCWALDRLLEKG